MTSMRPTAWPVRIGADLDERPACRGRGGCTSGRRSGRGTRGCRWPEAVAELATPAIAVAASGSRATRRSPWPTGRRVRRGPSSGGRTRPAAPAGASRWWRTPRISSWPIGVVGGDEAAGARGAAVEADGRGLEAELAVREADEAGGMVGGWRRLSAAWWRRACQRIPPVSTARSCMVQMRGFLILR
jgi:hypothetical protein